MSQCNLFAFHTMFNLLYSGGGKKIRGHVSGCGWLFALHAESGPPSRALGFAATPPSSQAGVAVAISDGAIMGSVQG